VNRPWSRPANEPSSEPALPPGAQLPFQPDVAMSEQVFPTAPVVPDAPVVPYQPIDPFQPAVVPTAESLPVAVIDIRRASRTYYMGDLEVPALVEADLRVDVGEFVAVIGPSGSGKTTLMNLIGCLDRPTVGEVWLAGTSVADLDDDRLATLRSRFVGFVFQAYNLLPRTSALENVAAPLLYQGVGRQERLERAKVTLERLGLGDRLGHQPTELSGGQQQRVAIARALVTNPPLILADEPTGNLDSHAGAEVLAILRELHAAGRTIVLITHDSEVAAAAPRQIHIRDGRLVA
jgi:putative ABC transport system ATP-binding protein